MQLQKLFEMQRQLDDYIMKDRVEPSDLFEKKALALLVELAELANETRCFKFWSNKGPSEKAIILEEYVDSIHFILSLGIIVELDDLADWPQSDQLRRNLSLTDLFIETNAAIQGFIYKKTEHNYLKIWEHYDALAKKLHFTNEEIMQAYLDKNQENYNRQNTGY